jgi:hypothetical protein
MKLRDNEHKQRISVNERYKMMTSRLSANDWKEIRNKQYWLQRDKLVSVMQKQIFTINWVRLWNSSGQVGNNVTVPPRPDSPETKIQPNEEF